MAAPGWPKNLPLRFLLMFFVVANIVFAHAMKLLPEIIHETKGIDTKDRNLQYGYFELRSIINNGYCLDVKNGSSKNFTPLWLYECNGTAAQKFSFDSDGRIHSQINYNLCVEMDPAYGVFVYSACFDEWVINDYSSSYMFIRNIGDDMCIASKTFDSFSMTNGTPVFREECEYYNSNAGLKLCIDYAS